LTHKELILRKLWVGVLLLMVAGLVFGTTPQKPQKSVKADKKVTAVSKKSVSNFKSESERLSYAIGMDIGTFLDRLNAGIDPKTATQAILDVMSGSKTQMSDEEARSVRQEFSKKRREMAEKLKKAAQEKQQKLGEQNLAKGRAFLAKNKQQPGVVTEQDGLQYLVIKEGKGPSPTLDDEVTVNYTGTLVDGTVFDSSSKRGKPAVFPVKGLIKGFSEGLLKMKEGGKYRLFIPANLAYGNQQRSELIGPNSTLIFDVDLLSIQHKEKKAAPVQGKETQDLQRKKPPVKIVPKVK